MIPRLRAGEIVRVQLTGKDWPESDSWIDGLEGIVSGVSRPNDDGTGWAYEVWISRQGEERTLWNIDEAELRSEGAVERETGDRVAADLAAPPRELRDCIYLDLVTGLTEEATARRVAGVVEASLRALIDARSLAVELRTHWHEPHHYEVRMLVEPCREPLAACDQLVTSCPSGWLECKDDGWRRDLLWSQSAAEPGASFLAAEVQHAAIGALPWSSPCRRPSHEGRRAPS